MLKTLFIPFLSTTLILLSTTASAQETDTSAYAPTERIFHGILAPNQFNVTLPDSFVVPNSDIVMVDSLKLQHGSDYHFNFIDGSLTLTDSAQTERAITVAYRIFPFQLKKSYSHRTMVYAQPDSTADKPSQNADPRQIRKRGQGAKLKKSGSIVRGISVGSNQSLSVDSGLRLEVSGRLTKDIEIIASLTDQNTPIQPEGNTQTLQEIDKVFMQVKSPNLTATLGDYTLKMSGGQFTNYQRKLEGIMAEGNFSQADFKASIAVSRGQFITNEFQGAEGNQGPYQLTGKNGNINILTLAGTERVWLDGEQLTRGINNDYVIEYGNGQITFTRNRLITQDSRITVDFQYSDESFQRSYLAAQTGTRLFDDKVKLQAVFIRETDNKNNPLSLSLSDDVRTALKEAGDSLAILAGDTLVAAGEGLYIKEEDGFFSYVGKGNGNYNVRFSFFGSGKGDYINIGLGRFEYAGKGLGDYSPFVILAAAQKHEMIGLNLNVQPLNSVQLQGEFAHSNQDKNLYSQLNDADNGGDAWQIRLRLNPQRLLLSNFDLGKIEFIGKMRRKSTGFRDIDRSNVAEFGRRWNLPQNSVNAKEDILEAQTEYLPRKGFLFHGGIGRLARSGFHSDRIEFRGEIEQRSLPTIHYFAEIIDRTNDLSGERGSWFRQRALAKRAFNWLKPLFEFEAERKKDERADSTRSGFRFESYTGGLELTPSRSFSASARYKIRDDKDLLNGAFQNKSIARTQTYGLKLNRRNALTLDASFTHRERNFADSAKTRADLADIRMTLRPKKGWLRSNWYYQIANTQIARQDEIFIEVEQGEGNFRFNEDLGEYEPDPFGNFVRRIFSTNRFIPVVELKMHTDIRLSLAKLLRPKSKTESKLEKEKTDRLAKLLAPISMETFIRIDERTREKQVAKIYLLNLDHFQQDSTTIFGAIELRQDFHLWQNSRDLSLRYRYRSRRELNNQFIGGAQKRLVLQQQLSGLYKLSSKFSAKLDLTNTKEDRTFQASLREDRRIRSNEVKLDFIFRPKQAWELASKGLFSLNRDLTPTPFTRAGLLTIAPRISYAFNQKGRFRGEFDWTKVTVNEKGRLLPFELTDGRRAGITLRWNLAFEYRISKNMNSSISYFGRSEPDRPTTQHVAKVEMRAFF